MNNSHPNNDEPNTETHIVQGESHPSTTNSVEGLFVAALAKSDLSERKQFLDEACRDNADVRVRVDALLRAYGDAGSFLDQPHPGLPDTQTLVHDFFEPTDDPELIGKLGSYEVIESIGRGGMGIVFRARDTKLNRIVAIKVLAPHLAADPNSRRRFLREAQAAAAISHPHVVTIHAVEDETPGIDGTQGLPYLVMECIIGATLQQKLDKTGFLRLAEILRIGQQSAEGLAAAHRQGLVHRDIKPANILLENGVERVKISDFGLARALDDLSITHTGEVSGTPQYMSPEQANGDRVDQRSDLFSLGCVFYALCTGRSPFRAPTFAAAIKKVCQDAPQPIEEINPEIPAWLIETIEQLLEKNPAARPQTANEIAKLLGDQLANLQSQPGVSPGRAVNRIPRSVASVDTEAVVAPTAETPVDVPSTGHLHAVTPFGFLAGLAGFSIVVFLVWLAMFDGMAYSKALVHMSRVPTINCVVFLALTVLLKFSHQSSRWGKAYQLIFFCGLIPALLMPCLAMAVINLLERFSMDMSVAQEDNGWLWLALAAVLVVWGALTAFTTRVIHRQLLQESNPAQRAMAARRKVGMIVLIVGLMIAIGLVGWFVGVAFEVIPASQQVRDSASFAAMLGLGLSLYLMAIGLVMRNKTATLGDFVFLSLCLCLGPVGLVLYRLRKLTKAAEAGQASLNPNVGSQDG